MSLVKEYDEKADALYIYLNPDLRGKKGVVDHTEETKSQDVCVDFTKDGEIVGISILNASKHLDIGKIKRGENA